MDLFTNEYFMQQAFKEALKAQEMNEIPIGAVVVSGDHIIARAHNQTEQLNDCTAHAEILAITSASNYLGTKYLHDCVLYVTLEPCVMCAGALYWSQIGRVVFAAEDPKRGFMSFGRQMLHPKTRLQMGIMNEESAKLLKEFFERRREKKNHIKKGY